MKLTIKHLRSLVKEALASEGAGGMPSKAEPFIGDETGSQWNSREQLAALRNHDLDTEEGDELPPHLREPMYDDDECFGPVPPDAPPPSILSDPFVRDSSPLPTSGIRRG